MNAVHAVEFQTVAACNARCTVCPWPEVSPLYDRKTIADATWTRLLHGLARLRPRRIIPYLNNEPLLDKRLEERIGHVRGLLPSAEVEVSTNAALLDGRRAERLIAAGVTHLHVSIFGHDGPSQRDVMGLDLDRVRTNLEQLVEARRRMGADVFIQVVQVRAPGIDPEALSEARRQWEAMGLATVEYGYLTRAGNLRGGPPAPPERDPDLRPGGCELNRPEERIYVLADGSVLFCCHDWRKLLVMGNIDETPLDEIWNGRHYERVRAMVRGERRSERGFLCRSCKLCKAPSQGSAPS